MSHTSLAARYRPQTFGEVTGQAMVKTILSRAAAQDKVAPAYLFSGTRGVGKTTLARIFAKALNCVHAPTAEPCNVCDQCRSVTMGNHVDVVEIDGASNNGVEEARHLKETIGYAPMGGRYKVFIIDEAHMLSRNAFNALLKTLEEPPPRAIFIMATTEPHKFPPTIVSRCQHFVFHAQPESEMIEHLRRVLDKEGIAFEESALRLIARRAAGSVRDGMSLLGQTLALGGDRLDEAVTRDVLGVAGQEAYERLLAAVRGEDCTALVLLTRELLDRGIDIGFFLRELTTLWRNLFLIRQAGPAAAQALDLPDDERDRLVRIAPDFDLTFIHAAWHLVLESQRQVQTSLEPAAALELLLLNLALLTRLVSLETLSAIQSGQTSSAGQTRQPEPAQESPHAAGAHPVPETRPAATPATPTPSGPASAPPDWNAFLAFCENNVRLCGPVNLSLLRQARGAFQEDKLAIRTVAATQRDQLSAPGYLDALRRLAAAYRGGATSVDILPPETPVRTEAELKKEMAARPEIQTVIQAFDAQLLRCTPVSAQTDQSVPHAPCRKENPVCPT